MDDLNFQAVKGGTKCTSTIEVGTGRKESGSRFLRLFCRLLMDYHNFHAVTEKCQVGLNIQAKVR